MNTYQALEYTGVALITGGLLAVNIAAAVVAFGAYLLAVSVLAQMGGTHDD